MKKIFKIFLVSFLLVGFASLSLAQRQTGSVSGKVTDNEGAPLPGASVTLSGAAVMGTLTYTTTESGDFRFPAVPPGRDYVLTVEMAGFQKVKREGIIVNIGKTVSINFNLTPATISEEVTVTAPSPVVDTESSKTAVSYSKDLLENVPSNRSLFDVIRTAPGTIEWLANWSASGGTDVYGSRYSFDGLSMMDPMTVYAMTNMNVDLIEEIEMELGAHPAEVGGVSGSYINVVTSSGGNEFHGKASAYYFNESFVDKNLTKEQLDTFKISGPSAAKSTNDFSGTIGGPVIKNRLWFFGAGRYMKILNLIAGFPKDVDHKEYFGFGKLTLQVSKNIKWMGYFNYEYSYEQYRSGNVPITRYTTPDAVLNWDQKVRALNTQLNLVISKNSYLDIRGMIIRRRTASEGQPGSTHLNYDKGTNMNTGGTVGQSTFGRDRDEATVSYTLFVDRFLGGNHEFKFGLEFESGRHFTDNYMPEPIKTYTWFGSPYYLGGNKGQFDAYGYGPTKGEAEEKVKVIRYGFYAQDSLNIGGRLTFNLGLRYDSSHGYLPAQSSDEVPYWLWLNPVFFSKKDFPERKDLIVWNSFSPRLGLVFDVFGDGKTIAKASLSRYHGVLAGTYFSSTNPNGSNYIYYYWWDENYSGKIDAGDSFQEYRRMGRTDQDPKKLISPDLKGPYWDEIIVGMEHELLHDFKLGVSYVWKRNKNMVENIELNGDKNWANPYSVKDPGYDGVFGTTDDQQLIIWDRTAPYEGMYFTNPKDAYRKYQGLEFIFEKRMSNKWQFLGSIIYSKIWGTLDENYFSASGATSAFDNPNYMINRDGRLDFDRPLVIKLQGTYILPYGIILSGYFVNSSGEPYTRSVSVYAPKYGSYVSVLAEPKGKRRLPSWNNLDLRLEKQFALRDFGKLGLFLDAYNILNSATVNISSSFHGYIEKDGKFTTSPAWHAVSSVSEPRVIKLGIRFTF